MKDEAEVRRVLIVGDTHGNPEQAINVIDYAARLKADLILQVGDFGYWPRDDLGRHFLKAVEQRLAKHNVPLWWIDGNHEDFDALEAQAADPDGRRKISEHIWHLPRGFRWQWADRSWVAIGGAVSVDKNQRREGTSWFAREELTDDEASAIIANGPADIVVAHDAPLGVPFLRRRLQQDLPAWRRITEWPTGLIMRSDEHQRRIRRVLEGVQASRLFHGHHHMRYSDVLQTAHGPVQIEGLGMDYDPISERTILVDANGCPKDGG